MNEIYTWPANDYRNYLAHHGILGMKWGIRRFQNPDGSLTPEGRERYGYGEGTTKRLDPRLETSFNPSGLSDKEIEITNKYADRIVEDAEKDLLKSGFSQADIIKERAHPSGLYADAIERSWENLRDRGYFSKSAKDAKNYIPTKEERNTLLKSSSFKKNDDLSGRDSETWTKFNKSPRGDYYSEISFNTEDKVYNIKGYDKPFFIKADRMKQIEDKLSAIKDFDENRTAYENALKKAIIKEFRSEGYVDQNVTNSTIEKSLNMYWVTATEKNYVHVDFYDKNGIVGYHDVSLEFDLKKKKPNGYVEFNG